MTVFPVVQSIPFCDPLTAFAPLAKTTSAVLLDSALESRHGRFSYIAVDPFRTVRCSPYPWTVTVDDRPCQKDPFTALADELRRFSVTYAPNAPAPFLGGAIGFYGYELGGVLEALPTPKSTPYPWDMSIGFYDVIAAFDSNKREAWVISSGFPESEPDRQEQRARSRAQELIGMLGTEPLPPFDLKTNSPWRSDVTQKNYEACVAKAIDATYSGDIYQANYSQRFETDASPETNPFDVYRSLRANAPAPFAAYMNVGEGMHILSASPERFLEVEPTGAVESRPIKGTRPRGSTPDSDKALARDLLESTKDHAENLMIVDLLRNDLSRVCQPGSVSVDELCQLETYPAVHHLVSSIRGHLQPGKTAVDLLRAAFPGGSITGAPKIRAMEVIHELEVSARGPYCGTIGWLGFDGAMDSSIVIRTLVMNGNKIVAQAGGGIVAESSPSQEYEESLTKAHALLAALNNSGVQ